MCKKLTHKKDRGLFTKSLFCHKFQFHRKFYDSVRLINPESKSWLGGRSGTEIPGTSRLVLCPSGYILCLQTIAKFSSVPGNELS